MISLSYTLKHGLLICLPFTGFVLISFWGWPRLWLHSLPPDIAQMAGPKTEAEKKQTIFLLIPYLLILPGLSIASTIYLAWAIPIDLSFLSAFVHIYGIWIIVHVWDFAIIDLAHILLIDSQRPPIPGTEGAKGYGDYGFHFRSLLRAVPMSLFFVAPVAAIVSLLF